MALGVGAFLYRLLPSNSPPPPLEALEGAPCPVALPEPDASHARLAELRQRLEALGLRINAAPVGSPERDRLSEQFGEVLGGRGGWPWRRNRRAEVNPTNWLHRQPAHRASTQGRPHAWSGSFAHAPAQSFEEFSESPCSHQRIPTPYKQDVAGSKPASGITQLPAKAGIHATPATRKIDDQG
jgi:hypothetical protein